MYMSTHGQNSACKPFMVPYGGGSTIILLVSHDPWTLPFALCWPVQLAHDVFYPPLASVAPRVPPGTIQRGAQNITEQCFTRFTQPKGPNMPAAMLFREALA